MSAAAEGGGLYAAGDSAHAELARGFAWFWKLGDLRREPDSRSVGFGGLEDAAELSRLVSEGRLAGAVLTVSDPGPRVGPAPARRRVSGEPRFAGGTRVRGEFTIFEEGEPAVSSSLGTHAVIAGDVLVLGHDPAADWGRVDAFWAYEAVAEFLPQRLGRPLQTLPPMGCLRLDDTPATALHQLQERASTDSRQARRLRTLARKLNRNDAVLSLAVVAQALDAEGRRAPMEEVYPDSIRSIQEGIGSGAYEPICHGLIHMDPDALERREIEYTEFRLLEEDRAAEHIDRAMEWQRRVLGEPSSFCAPAWSYGPASDRLAAERGLVRWYRARPGPLLEDGRIYESLIGELQGLYRLDYSPLVRLAAIGIPPIVAMHGALLDGRIEALKATRDLLSAARLFFHRDVNRLMELEGVDWVSSSKLIAELRAWG